MEYDRQALKRESDNVTTSIKDTDYYKRLTAYLEEYPHTKADRFSVRLGALLTEAAMSLIEDDPVNAESDNPAYAQAIHDMINMHLEIWDRSIDIVDAKIIK